MHGKDTSCFLSTGASFGVRRGGFKTRPYMPSFPRIVTPVKTGSIPSVNWIPFSNGMTDWILSPMPSGNRNCLQISKVLLQMDVHTFIAHPRSYQCAQMTNGMKKHRLATAAFRHPRSDVAQDKLQRVPRQLRGEPGFPRARE
jgi:hypothetical protein